MEVNRTRFTMINRVRLGVVGVHSTLFSRSLETGTTLIAWDKVCKPKKSGGLGVLDITTHNQALLMKFLHKFLNKEDIPWVNIIWETNYQTSLPGDRMVGSFWWKSPQTSPQI